MAKNDLGRTIIDELRLCYSADPTLIEELSNIDFEEWINFSPFSLKRCVSRQFKYSFDTFLNDDNINPTKVATLRYGHLNEKEPSSLIYYRIENEVLYNKEKLITTLTLPDMLGMIFQHITSIDLAQDNKYNILQRIRKIAKDPKIKVIKHGKVTDKTKDIQEGTINYTLNFTRLSSPSLTLKQAKAQKDKTRGLTLCAYNKRTEIEAKSHKYYILDFYGNPKTLHRLEVHQNNNEIKDYCKTHNITQTINLIFNQQFLDNMYYTHLASILRFTRGRTPLKWHEILHPQVMITTIPTNAKEAG